MNDIVLIVGDFVKKHPRQYQYLSISKEALPTPKLEHYPVSLWYGHNALLINCNHTLKSGHIGKVWKKGCIHVQIKGGGGVHLQYTFEHFLWLALLLTHPLTDTLTHSLPPSNKLIEIAYNTFIQKD